MFLSRWIVKQLEAMREQFNLSTSVWDEPTASFRPSDNGMTVAQQIAHAAQVMDWLVDGASNPHGFDLDFEPHIERTLSVPSLGEARLRFLASVDRAIAVFQVWDDRQWIEPLPDGPVMGGLPRLAVAFALVEHTSHHRGALAVYARLNGLVPPSPYGI